MKRALAGIPVVVLALALAACGSSADPKVEMLDGIRAAAIESGLTEAQAACVVDGLDDLTIDQLNAIADDTADAATKQAYTFVAAQCLLGS